MTTYDGRAASFVPGREVPNREPPVSKFVVEKLYKVHRERVLSVEPVVDCYSQIPSFLGDTTWKQIALEHKQKEIANANEIMYGRIEKQAKEESQIKKESREHVKRVLDIKKHTKRLKENGRLHKEMLLRKENELLHARIERARPQYTLKSMKEWYKYHQNFKDGRRTDPTAGHIMKVSSKLLPESLPKVSDSLDGGFRRAQTPLFQSSVLSKGKKDKSQQRPSTSPVKLQHSASMSLLNLMNSGSEVMAFPEMPGFPLSGKAARMSMSSGNNRDVDVVNHRRLSVLAGYKADVCEEKALDATTGDELLAHMVEMEALYVQEEENKGEYIEDDVSITECLHSRPFSIPYDHRNCCVQVRVNKNPNLLAEETLEFRVYNLETPPQILSKRNILESRAKTIVNAKTNAMHKVATEENMGNLRTMLIEMFQEVDDDANGFLTFDEFEILMEKMELGVSKQELRFVISEADDNGNGVVDFDEFVPLAVDLIQSFSAKIKAKLEIGEEEVADDLELASTRAVLQSETDMIAQTCLEKLKSFDTHGYGVIRIGDLKRCLINVSHMGIKEIEINLVANLLPKDTHGRAIYSNFPSCFTNARFAAEKMARVDNSKSLICRKLIELCNKQEIIENSSGGDEESGFGLINVRNFTHILQHPEFNLSRLQVLVLMSESYTTDGMLQYYQYVPTLARTIEKMFDPKVLRQRAELITKTDLSVDALLEKMPPNAFDERLFALFKSHDIDHNGVLNEEEFRRCLDSLDLGLSRDEILLFLISADSTHTCLITFEDFKRFFKENLKNLNSDKHLRTVQNLVHSSSSSKKAVSMKDQRTSSKLLRGRETAAGEKEMTTEEVSTHMKNSLRTIFQTLDPENHGSVSFTEVDKVLRQLNASISEYQLSVILAEVPIDDHGNLRYNEFIPKLVALLMAFRANEEAEEVRHAKEEKAYKKAEQAINKSPHVMNSIIQFLKQRFLVIDTSTDDPKEKQPAVIAAIKNSHSGLTAKEANILSSKFCKMMFNKGPPRRGSVSTVSSGSLHLKIGHRSGKSNSSSSSSRKASDHNIVHDPDASPQRAARHEFSEIGVSDSYDSHDGNSRSGKLYCGITSTDIKAHVYDVRKQSLVRSYLEIDADTIDFKVFDALHQESLTLIEDGLIEKGSKYIPASIAMNILRYHSDLHLDRSQIFSIMTLADHCYDETHKNVHYVKFAAFAANIIVGLHTEDTDRHEDDEKIHNEDISLLNGLTDEEMDSYLQESFTKYELNDSSHKHEVELEVFKKIIKETPKVDYSDKEVAFIVNTFPVNDTGMIHWGEYMHWAHGMAHSIARDRLVNRQELLQKQAPKPSPIKIDHTNDDNKSVDSVTSINETLSPTIQILHSSTQEKEKEKRLDELAVLAQKVMNYVKIKLQGGEATVAFPDDPSNKKAINGSSEVIEEDNAEVLQILKASKMVPCISDLDNPNDINYKTKRIACLFNIIAVNSVILRISLISIDGRYVIYQDLPISLPSLGLVDSDLAREFASNCADLLYIETSYTGEVLKMRV